MITRQWDFKTAIVLGSIGAAFGLAYWLWLRAAPVTGATELDVAGSYPATPSARPTGSTLTSSGVRELSGPHDIEVRITAAGSPQADVLVWTSPGEDRQPVPSNSVPTVTSSDDGTARLPRPNARDHIVALARNYALATVPPDVWPLQVDTRGYVEIRLQPSGRARFDCRTGSGAPCAGVRVVLSTGAVSEDMMKRTRDDSNSLPTAHEQRLHVATSRVDGEATFHELPPGDYRLYAYLPFASVRRTSATRPPPPITITPGCSIHEFLYVDPLFVSAVAARGPGLTTVTWNGTPHDYVAPRSVGVSETKRIQRLWRIAHPETALLIGIGAKSTPPRVTWNFLMSDGHWRTIEDTMQPVTRDLPDPRMIDFQPLPDITGEAVLVRPDGYGHTEFPIALLQDKDPDRRVNIMTSTGVANRLPAGDYEVTIQDSWLAQFVTATRCHVDAGGTTRHTLTPNPSPPLPSLPVACFIKSVGDRVYDVGLYRGERLVNWVRELEPGGSATVWLPEGDVRARLTDPSEARLIKELKVEKNAEPQRIDLP